MTISIRDAVDSDADACASIYAPYVESTAITFETDVPTAEQMRKRIAAAQVRHAWLIAEDEHAVVVGYAYAHPFAERAAYRWSCEVSVYVDRDRRRTGAGRALYGALLDRLADRGFRRALAGIALPNDASRGLHVALGFEPAGTYRRIGWKLGTWHDVAWWQRDLGESEAAPRPLR